MFYIPFCKKFHVEFIYDISLIMELFFVMIHNQEFDQHLISSSFVLEVFSINNFIFANFVVRNEICIRKSVLFV